MAHAAPKPNPGRSCHLPGAEEALRCVTVNVPSNYGAKDGRAIALHVTVAPSFRENARQDPLFVLAGGPGQAGSDVLPFLNAAFQRARATRDIVLIDQRGTGRSGKLDCESGSSEETMTEERALAELTACVRNSKVRFADYTTANAAHDIERVRLALGYDKINVWGASYGTRLAQAYARAYPKAVRSLVLDGVAPPEMVIPAGGQDAQAALDALFRQCAENKPCAAAFPRLREEFAELSRRAATGSVMLDLADPRTAKPLRQQLSNARFVRTVHSILYSPVDSRSLPYLIHSAYEGRWEPFIARSNVMSDFSSEEDLSNMLYLAVVCAEDVPRLDAGALTADTGASFMKATVTDTMIKACPALNVPAAPLAQPTRIEAPVLMLSGALDPVTPPRRAQSAARHMANAQHFVVENAGHGITTLGCAPRLLREFLDQPTKKLDAACLKEIPSASFQVGSAGPHP
ncbi:alpha/beta fold hydrolase [Pseudoduganella sp. GCM10020061]|uniref:alpha/beta fold hydrolase n=1 Tax=Pseudoduganella sp. GCM10020061 TaxID=3317345 RepID=UPI00363BCDCB